MKRKENMNKKNLLNVNCCVLCQSKMSLRGPKNPEIYIFILVTTRVCVDLYGSGLISVRIRIESRERNIAISARRLELDTNYKIQ